MQTIVLIVAYDGTPFSGWQRQAGARTIQGCLEAAISKINNAPTTVRGASRTDAGVHAQYQIAAFETDRNYPPDRWVQALNATTPPEIFIRRALVAPTAFEPRFASRGKHYRYTLYEGHFVPPHLLNRVARTRKLDIDNMRLAAQYLIGTHDFSSFRAIDCQAKSPIRTITQIDITRRSDAFVYAPFPIDDAHQGDESLIEIDVFGTAVLKQMVRIIVGTLIEFGLGRPAAEMIAIRDAKNRTAAGETAPASGLTLVRSWSECDDWT